MAEKVYKAVFECKALGEREVWWVSSRSEAEKHANTHIKTSGGKKVQKRYEDVTWTLTVKEVFGETHEVYYSNVNSWSGT